MKEQASNPLDDKVLKFEFTVREVNAFLNALGALPFIQAVGPINAIQAQATPQFDLLQAQEANNEPETTA
jgi:hypothetical protein